MTRNIGDKGSLPVAHWQALHAADPEIRAVAAALHDDEAGHAQLAWDVDAWANAHLSADARARVARAREQAIAELAAASTRPPPELAHLAGLPTGPEHQQLIAALQVEVWASSATA